jgi:UDP-N-acetylmuramate dehydrogenase
VEIKENVPLSSYSTMGLGGPALFFAKVATREDMQEAILFAKSKNLPFHVIGKGSNSIFSDSGFKGLAILNKIDFFHAVGPIFHVGSGYSFSLLGAQTAKQNWTGLEFASGIPATVGGAVFMNAGASGKETKDCLISVEFMDSEGEIRSFERDEIAFSYRKSSFQTMRGAIISATFQLACLEDARDKQLAIIQYRTSTQPYGDKSCGCAFRNPPNHFAGALIEKCGLKGVRIGGAEVSTLHANFIVNKDGATAHDIASLIAHIKTTVKEKEGIDLEVEVCFIHEL